MSAETESISHQALLEIANQMIQQHENYLAGMEANDVIQQGEVLVFRGPYFLDEEGLPTAKTTAVFNVFKHLAVVLSAQYHLA